MSATEHATAVIAQSIVTIGPDLLIAPLPAPLTPLVGRAAEIKELAEALRDPDVRLLTLLGPGGIGKTRLALAAAETVAAAFPDGAAFVALAPIGEAALLESTIAAALGLREAADRSLRQTLVTALHGRRLLLLLDNCEHLVAAAPAVAALLSACPRLVVLATSRQPLRISGEREWPVPPLSASSEAVALFVARARAIRPDFVLTAEIEPIVAEICERLDGLPLAIELAAARLKVLAPAALLTRFDRPEGARLPLLTRGLRDVPRRLLSMRDAIAWSYDLLDADEQAIFRRLSIFMGGFTLEAAAEVATGGDELAALDAITSLADKSLLLAVLATEDEVELDAGRYDLLETIREFGRERLAAAGEDGEGRARHAAWSLRLAWRAASEFGEATWGAWLHRFDTEHPNLRAALEGAIAHGDAATAFGLIANLFRFWEARGHLAEGCAWFDRAAALDDGSPDLRAAALCGAAVLWFRRGDYDRAAALSEESLAICRPLADGRQIAMALNVLGNVAHERGDQAQSRAYHEEALALRRASGDLQAVATTLINLGTIRHEARDYAGARELFAEALALRRPANDFVSVGFALTSLGRTMHRLGDLAAARRTLDEAIAIRRALNLGTLTDSLVDLAAVVRDAGDPARAATLLQEAITLRWARGEQRGLVQALAGFAVLAATGGQPEQAIRLFAAVEALRASAGGHLPAADAATREQALATARKALGRAASAAAWEEGRVLPLAQVVALAATVAPIAPPAGQGNAGRRAETIEAIVPGGLSPRQLDVLRLVAQGLTDAEVGERLFISPRTVSRHLQFIYTKLGVSTRTAAAAFAHEHGLA